MRLLTRVAILFLAAAALSSCGGDQQTAAPVGAVHAARLAAVAPGVDSDYETVVQQLYLGYFGRPADPGGLAYYTQAYRAAHAPTEIADFSAAYATNGAVRKLVDSFATSAESQQLYPDCPTLCAWQWVDALYQSLFSREPDIVGYQYWADALNQNGKTRAQVLLAVIAGARGADAALVARKVGVAIGFTRQLDATGQSAAYNGQIATLVVRAMLQNVPGMADDAAVQANVDATIGQLAALASGSVDDVAPGTRKILLLASPERMADNGTRLALLASALTGDLNGMRSNGPVWHVDVAAAAASVGAIRAQLTGYDGAILVGQVAVPTSADMAFLDVYRVPSCPAYDMDEGGRVSNGLAMHSADPRCQNGLVLSILRGTTSQADAGEVAAKLDQMVAYHRASAAANASWTRRFRLIEAGWFSGPEFQWGDQSAKWADVSLYPAAAISYQNTGTAVQRRDAFLDCIGQNNEICGANLHGASASLDFEGQGTPGVFYADDAVSWSASDLAPQFVKAKYIELASCSTQDFLRDNSVGTTLLMRGAALLTRGTVTVVLVASTYEEDIIKNEYALLQNGSTFAESVYGRLEGSPVSLQGDPYITLRPAPTGAQPKLLIDGRHFNGGAQTVPITMPDAAGGASAKRVVTFSNRGNADLHVRIDSMFAQTGVDYGTSQGGEYEYGADAQYDMDPKQVLSDGRVLAWPAFTLEQNGGAMPLTLKPGESVAVTYRLNVRTDAAGLPKRPGLYTGQLMVMSDDPGSARVFLAMQGRVR